MAKRLCRKLHSRFRDECLACKLTGNLPQTRAVIESQRVDYNEHRAHSVLGNLTPKEFASSGQASPAR
ncbi:integrase core domain-containing protein [Planctomycetes bacterium CA13]|uniref:integrase core domain-containing protein n=1 Tax=Novipirellula herctigrandis TaxID=2527986 RepID=UPI0011B39DAC